MNLLVRCQQLQAFDQQSPNDVSYVYSGYAPLSVRLAQLFNRPSGWRPMADLLNLLPGPMVEEIQQLPIGLRKRRKPMRYIDFLFHWVRVHNCVIQESIVTYLLSEM